MIYTSTVAVFGDTGGRTVDESYHYRGPFLTEYDRTKWLAHYEMALPLIARGAPLIIVMPGGVYGPGDPNITGQLMRAFYQGRLRVLYGPETTLTYAYVDDVAEGHLLAAEKGEIGESYVLAGPPVPLGEMVRIWARLTGKPAPRLSIPTSLVRPVAPLAGLLERVLRVPEMYTAEAIRSLGVTYVARADRAREQLGWNSRPLEEGLRDTLHWIAESTALRGPALHRNRSLARLALLVAALVAISWYRCHARRPDRG